MSCSFPQVDSPSKSTDIIPPTRRIRQRTAAASKPTAITSSGAETRNELTIVTALSNNPPLLLAAHTPNGMEISHVSNSAVVVSSRVFFARLHSNGETGTLYAMEYPKSACRADFTHRPYLNSRG